MPELFDKKVYMVVENPSEEDAAIELTGGEWDGLVYQYGKLQFEEGKPRLGYFKGMIGAARAHDWKKMAYEMEDSKWFGQVGRRSKELQELVLNV